jgi:hypothetical protein
MGWFVHLHRSPNTQFPFWKNLQVIAAGLLLARSWEYRQLLPSLQSPCMKYLEIHKSQVNPMTPMRPSISNTTMMKDE